MDESIYTLYIPLNTKCLLNVTTGIHNFNSDKNDVQIVDDATEGLVSLNIGLIVAAIM